MPGDEVVLRMAEVSGMHILAYWHMLQKSRIAAAILPELNELGLPEAVLGLLIELEHFQGDGMKKFIRIAADGKIADEEQEEYEEALLQLRELLAKGHELGYAN